jgi:hypothetical protein
MLNLFLVHFVNLYMLRAYLGGTIVRIQQFVLIILDTPETCRCDEIY